MKRTIKTTTLLLLSTSLFVLGLANSRTVKADSNKLSAGQEVSVSNVSGNLDNVNIKFEFTSNVNLDGTNNALLVGLAAADGSMLTDAKFIGVASSVVYDENNIALSFKDGKVPAAIGTKTGDAAPYTYSFESRDFTVSDATKDIAKLVVVGQKGTEIDASISFSEVKYSVKFGDSEAVSYSYNALITAPSNAPAYTYDINNHQQVTGWADADSNAFVAGSSKATKDVNYLPVSGADEIHTWNHVNEVAATANTLGTKAHEECACGAKKLASDSTTLATAEELRIGLINHVHDYQATFDWSGATNPGDKPTVSYTCQVEACKDHHDLTDSEIAVAVKEGTDKPASCEAAGGVTYVATATYNEVVKTCEHEYVRAQLAHTMEHHDAVAKTLEADGCVEHWTCSECGGYFLDAVGTKATTAEGVKLAKYTLENAQLISVSDLKSGDKINGGSNHSKAFSYDLTGAPANKSVIFFANLEYVAGGDIQIYLTSGTENWNFAGCIWIQEERVIYKKTDANGVILPNDSDYVKTKYGYNLEAGTHAIVYGRQAIMDGDTFTGLYHIFFKLDGEEIFSVNQAVESKVSNGGTIHITSEMNLCDTYVKETPKEISVSDLQKGGKSVGENLFLSSQGDYTFDNNDAATNGSLVFKFKYYVDENSDRQFHFVSSDISNYGDAKWWGAGSFILNKGSVNLGKPAYDVSKNYAWNDNNDIKLAKNTEYLVEYGRIALSLDGAFTGKYYSYLKIDGDVVLSNVGYLPTEYIKGNAVFITGKADGGAIRISEINPTSYVFEDADIISVNDLCVNSQYASSSIDLVGDGLRVYTYNGKSTYGSVVFKGIFNIDADHFESGDDHGTQIRFDDAWVFDGYVWIQPGGALIQNPDGYLTGKVIPTGKDVNVEIGRLAIMNGEEFSGVHYIYVKYDGVLVNEYYCSSVTAETYAKKVISFTCKVDNLDHEIKNVANEKTVTLKVGQNTPVDVKVLRSGLVVIPSYTQEQLGGEDMRIVGWTIEGTETKFNPLTDRIFGDITIVATISDEFLITFKDFEVIPVVPGEAIVLPSTNPTKAYDDTNHYVFDCWVDADGNPFVAGTLSTGDATYTARFTTVAHSYGEWEVVTAKTCEQAGQKKQACECGHTVYEAIPASHELTHHDAVAATCTVAGSIEYWECEDCHKLYKDENATVEASEADLVVAAHGLTHHDAKASTYTANGNIEYWECETCHKYYKDANATVEASEADLIVAPAHKLTKVEAKAATCGEDGNIEYYHCSECNKNFKDAEGKTQVTNVKVAATGDHNYGADGICSVCGEEDPNHVHEESSSAEQESSQVISSSEEKQSSSSEKESFFKRLFKGCKSSVSVSVFGTLGALAALLFMKKRNIH